MDWFDVMRRFENGDATAFEQLSTLVREKLSRMRRRSGSDNTEDVGQDTLLCLLRAWRRGCIREERCFEGFVWKLAQRRLVDAWNRQSRPGAPDVVGDPEHALDHENVLDEGERREDVLDLARALDRLEGAQQRALRAIYLEGQTYQEAAEILGLPLGTFKRKLGNGLKSVRAALM